MIIFKNIRFKNLMSYGNQFTEISLNEFNRTLIIGTNGSGKSTIIEAIVFALYGKPYRKINKPQLINSITKKELVVEIEFNDGFDEYKVIRGIKPNIFEIFKNDELLNQTGDSKDYQDILETQILKKTYRTFLQVDILGAAKYTSFMELSAPQRREVVEDLLDLQIFSNMNIVAKNQLKECIETISNLEHQYNITKVELDSIIKVKESSKQLYQDQISSIQHDITNLENDIEQLKSKIAEVDIQIIVYGEIQSTKKLIEQKNKIVEAITKLKYNIETLDKDIQFFNSNDSCPTCMQRIEEKFKSETVEMKLSKIEELNSLKSKIENKKKILNNNIEDVENNNKILLSLENRKKLLDCDIHSRKHQITEQNKKITLIHQKIENITDNSEDLSKKQNEIKYLEENLNQEKEKKKRLNMIISSLKDTGVKALIIKEYIPILNKLINQYLTKMDFMVSFELTETFEEIIKSRYRDDFSYASFSEGQKKRIDTALLFSFRDIANMRNSVSSNLCIMDEIFDSSLDAEGTEKMLDIIQNSSNISNIIVISHQTDNIIDSFDRVLEFSLNKNFSQMKEIS